ncbi:hypothetical protein MMC30_009357 [Trapelia coarctata]|nr:hypothetical protein [Trapelia coarctata]
MDASTLSLLHELSIYACPRPVNIPTNHGGAKPVPQVRGRTSRCSGNASSTEVIEWRRYKSGFEAARIDMGHSGNIPPVARSRGSSSSTLVLESADIDECWLRRLDVQLLPASLTSDFASTGSTASSSAYVIDRLQYADDLIAGLITWPSLHLCQSRFSGSSCYGPKASAVCGWSDENPTTSSNGALAEGIRGPYFLDGQADDVVSISTASRRRSRTQIFDARDHGEFSFGAGPRWPHERRFRSIEESTPTPQIKARRYIQPVREHVVQRWKQIRRKPRSDSPTPTIGRSFSLRLPGPGHRSRIQSTLDIKLASNDKAGSVEIYSRRRPEAHRTHSASALPQRPVSGPPGEYPSIATRSAPLATTLSTLSDDEEEMASDGSISEKGGSYFDLGEERAERSLRTEALWARLHRVSTAGTTVFSPRIIAEARPNAEKLNYCGNAGDSSSDSSGGIDEMSFL